MARLMVAMVGTVVATAAGAADSPGSGGHRDSFLPIEISAFGGYAVGGQFRMQGAGADDTGTGDRLTLGDHSAYALAADLRADENTRYELFYSRESTDLRLNQIAPHTNVTVEYLHVGGMLVLNDEVNAKPYAVGGLGVARLSPGEQGSTDTRFSVSLGLGLQYPVTERFSVRLEGRGFVTLVGDNTAVFCASDQNGLLCRVHGNGRTFIQGQFLAGVSFAF